MVTIRAYVLIEVVNGSEKRVIASLRRLKGVKSADLLIGSHDAIAVIEATDLNEIADLIIGR